MPNEAAKCADLIRKYIYGTGLDIGCGEETVTPNCIGVDISLEHGHVHGDASSLPWFADDSVDFVFSSYCLDRIKDDAQALKEWGRVIKPGGYLVLYLPHADYHPNVSDNRSDKDRRHDYRTWDVVSVLQDQFELEVVESHLRADSDTEFDKLDHETAEYSFLVVARKEPHAIPDWAYRRFHVPVEDLLLKNPFEASSNRVAIVHEADLNPASVKGLKLNCEHELKYVDAEHVRDGGHLESKVAVISADVMVDLSKDGCALEWAVSYDVDAVATCPPKATFPWPRQAHVDLGNGADSPRWSSVAEAVEKKLKMHGEAFSDGVSLCMIAKNEKLNINTALDSVEGLANELIVVDTGSTDETAKMARDRGALVYYFPWRKDFGAARNYSLDRARKKWSFWMDADDTFLAKPKDVFQYMSTRVEAFSCEIRFGASRFQHCRFWLTKTRTRFAGLCHEFPVVDGLVYEKSPFAFEHSCAHTPGKDREKRNVELMAKAVFAQPKDPRQWFYYGNALREAGKQAKAVDAYEHYLSIAFWRDEKNLAARHLADCHASLGNQKECRQALLRAIEIDDRWAEQYYALGRWYKDRGDIKQAVAWFEMAASKPLHASPLFKIVDIYEWKCHDELAACYEQLGMPEKALNSARIVAMKTKNETKLKSLERITEKKPADTACDLCGETATANMNRMGSDYVRCACDVIYPIEGELQTNVEKITPHSVLASVQWRGASEYIADYIHNHAARELGQDKLKVLEIMTSIPYLSAKLADMGDEVSCVDASKVAAGHEMAEKLDFHEALWQDFEVPDEWKGAFDVVVLVHALDHMPRIKRDFGKAVECLRPGGLVFSRHPDWDSPGVENRADTNHVFWVLNAASTNRLAKELDLTIQFRKVKERGGEADVWFRKGVKVGDSSAAERPAAPPIILPQNGPILVGRNGSIGDILMTTYAVRKLKEAVPERDIYYMAHPACSTLLDGNPHVRAVLDVTAPDFREVVAKLDPKSVSYFEYPTKSPRATGCAAHVEYDYPNKPLPFHLVDIYAECVGINERHSGEWGSLEVHFADEELEFGREQCEGGRVFTLQTRAGWSRYKEWYPHRWADVVRWCLSELDARVIHLGGQGEQPIFEGEPPDGYVDLRGKCSIRESASVIKHADLHLGIDSVYNHVTNAVRTPGVILWGSTHPIGSGYPHNTNLVKPPEHGCQPCYRERAEMTVHYKPPCPHNIQCMLAIKTREVVEAIRARAEAVVS